MKLIKLLVAAGIGLVGIAGPVGLASADSVFGYADPHPDAATLYADAVQYAGADYAALAVNVPQGLDDLIFANSVEAQWLPLDINADGNIDVVLYVNTRFSTVANRLAPCGPVHASPEVDACRFEKAKEVAVEAVILGEADVLRPVE